MPFKNHEDQLAYNKIYWQRTQNIQRVKGKEYREKRRLKVLSYYAKGDVKCACCGETQLEFLSIDHINGGGTKQKKELGTRSIYAILIKQNLPLGYRVLCHNCNQAMGFYGHCPHNKMED